MATDLNTGVLSLTSFRDHLTQRIDEVQREGRTLVVTRNGRSVAIVLSPAEYEQLRYAAYVRGKVAAALTDAADGRTSSHGDVMRRARARLAPRRRS